MKKPVSIIILAGLLVFSSCSSMKKTIIYSALAGGLVGASAGAILSPDVESRGANAAIFGLIGAGVATLTGYALYQDDPRNYPLSNMLLDQEVKEKPNELELGPPQFKINANLEKKEAYPVPVKDLPPALEGKVNRQYLIKYESKEQYLKKGGRTFYVPAFDIYEHAYGENMQTLEGDDNDK